MLGSRKYCGKLCRVQHFVRGGLGGARVGNCLKGRIPAGVLLLVQFGTNRISISIFFPPEVCRPIPFKTSSIVLRSSPSCICRKLSAQTAAQFPYENIRELCLRMSTLLRSPSTESAGRSLLRLCTVPRRNTRLNCIAVFISFSKGRPVCRLSSPMHPMVAWICSSERNGGQSNCLEAMIVRKNHVQRFRPGSIYHGWGIIQDYILLDFCTKWPTNRDCMGKLITLASFWLLTLSTTDPNLHHVTFPENRDFVH